MPTNARQLEIPALMEAAAFAQESEIPAGVGEMSPREIKFVTRLLSHGQQGRAYEEAGYKATGPGAYVNGSKLLRKTKVFRFYRQCLSHVSQNAGRLIERVWERSILFHEKAIKAAQEVADLDARILEAEQSESGFGAKGPIQKSVRKYITARENMQREERHYAQLARQEDHLLGQLLGKIKDLNVQVDVSLEQVVMEGKTITPNVLDDFAKRYRERMQSVGSISTIGEN